MFWLRIMPARCYGNRQPSRGSRNEASVFKRACPVSPSEAAGLTGNAEGVGLFCSFAIHSRDF